MSLEAMVWAWDQEVDSHEVLLLLAVGDFCDEEGCCFPSQDALARKTRTTDRTVRANLGLLEDRGLLGRLRRHRPNGSRTSDLIALALDRPVSLVRYGGLPDALPEHLAGRPVLPEVDDSAYRKPTTPPEPSKGTTTSESSTQTWRPEILVLADLLAHRVRENGYSVRDPRARAWLTPVRLLLDRDVDPTTRKHWSVGQVRHAIMWATDDPRSFWKLNVRSPANLRKHFERIAAEIRQEQNGRPNGRARSERDMNSLRELHARQLAEEKRLRDAGLPIPGEMT